MSHFQISIVLMSAPNGGFVRQVISAGLYSVISLGPVCCSTAEHDHRYGVIRMAYRMLATSLTPRSLPDMASASRCGPVPHCGGAKVTVKLRPKIGLGVGSARHPCFMSSMVRVEALSMRRHGGICRVGGGTHQ